MEFGLSVCQFVCHSLVLCRNGYRFVPAPTNNSSYIGRVISFYFVFVFVFVFFYHLIGKSFWFLIQNGVTKFHGNPSAKALNAGIGKISVFSTNVVDYLGNGMRQTHSYYMDL